MSLFRRPLCGRGPGAPIVRVPPRPVRVVECEDEGSFAVAMQQAEAVRRNAPPGGERRQMCEVVIVTSNDRQTWRDAVQFWYGPWRPTWDGGVPLPSRADLIQVAREERARYARALVRSII